MIEKGRERGRTRKKYQKKSKEDYSIVVTFFEGDLGGAFGMTRIYQQISADFEICSSLDAALHLWEEGKFLKTERQTD